VKATEPEVRVFYVMMSPRVWVHAETLAFLADENVFTLQG
jgi:hypothetical protein